MAVKRWNGTAWEVYAGADLAPVKVTDGRVGKTTFIGATSPTGQVDGDIWIDQDTTTNAVVPTALTTKGDTFVATGNAAYTRLAAGNNGESLFADSSTSTGLRWQGDYNTGKNKILNGDFSIWQRGTSFTVGNAAYTSDRWYVFRDSNGSFTLSRQAFTPGSAPVAGYEGQYFLQIANTSNGSSTYAEFGQPIEDVRTFAGQTVTFSFWARLSSGNFPNTYVRLAQTFGSGGSASVSAGDYAIGSLTSNWTRYSITTTIASVSGKTIGPGSYFLFSMILPTAGSIGTIQMWGFQAEVGSVATQFTTNTANPQAELAACQRYYQKSYNTETAPGSATLAGIVVSAPSLSAVGSGLSFGHVPLKVDMRAAPSVVIYSYAGTVGAVSSGQPADLAASSGGVNTIGTRSFSLINNSGGSITPVNGSFIFHYTASAEL